MQSLFSSTLNVLHKNLNLRQQRHAIVTSNVANAETPGFIAKDIRFADTLRQAANPSSQGDLKRTNPHHLGSVSSIQDVQGKVVTIPSDDVGNDLNSVSIDQEMARLTMNAFHYNASTEILSRMFSLLRHTISEGQ